MSNGKNVILNVGTWAGPLKIFADLNIWFLAWKLLELQETRDKAAVSKTCSACTFCTLLQTENVILCLVTKCNFSIRYVVFYFSLLLQNIKKFNVIFINNNCFRLFYMLIIYFEKFSTWVCCLPFVVNVTLNLSILTLMLWYTGKITISSSFL